MSPIAIPKRKIGGAQYLCMSKSRSNRTPIPATHFASDAGKNAKKRRPGEMTQKGRGRSPPRPRHASGRPVDPAAARHAEPRAPPPGSHPPHAPARGRHLPRRPAPSPTSPRLRRGAHPAGRPRFRRRAAAAAAPARGAGARAPRRQRRRRDVVDGASPRDGAALRTRSRCSMARGGGGARPAPPPGGALAVGPPAEEGVADGRGWRRSVARLRRCSAPAASGSGKMRRRELSSFASAVGRSHFLGP